MITKRFTAFIALTVVTFGIFSFQAAQAYSSTTTTIPSAQSIQSSFETLIEPFQSFYQNLMTSIGTQPVVGPQSDMPQTPTFTIQNVQNISASEAVTWLLKGVAWVLDLTGELVQWLLSLTNK